MTSSSLSFWGLGRRIIEELVIYALSLGGRKHGCAFFPSPIQSSSVTLLGKLILSHVTFAELISKIQEWF